MNCNTSWNYHVLTGTIRPLIRITSGKRIGNWQHRPTMFLTSELGGREWPASRSGRFNVETPPSVSTGWKTGWGWKYLWKFSASSGNLTSDPLFSELSTNQNRPYKLRRLWQFQAQWQNTICCNCCLWQQQSLTAEQLRFLNVVIKNYSRILQYDFQSKFVSCRFGT